MAHDPAHTLPDRWVNCPRKGQLIEDKFLPFKTPLSTQYDESLEERTRFPPSLLLSISQNLPRPLGMVIDLTNSRRFYSPAEMNQIGLEHAKIPCEGHKHPPTKEQVRYIHSVLFLSFNCCCRNLDLCTTSGVVPVYYEAFFYDKLFQWCAPSDAPPRKKAWLHI